MLVVSNFALQYDRVDFEAISASSVDLFITEADPLDAPGITGAFTASQLEALAAQGRLIVGYVNVGVTDANRPYWHPRWTSNGDDLGAVSADAPAWLRGQPTNGFGVLVRFEDPAWQDIVVAQAVDVVSKGYSGVFLDDVASYFARVQSVFADTSAPEPQALIRQGANAMIELIARIKTAITEVNPNAIVVSSTDPYLPFNVTQDAAGQTARALFLEAVDVHLLENMPNKAALDVSRTTLAGKPVLILQSDGMPTVPEAELVGYGTLYVAPDESYNTLGSTAYRTTAGPDVVVGGNGPNMISGGAGNDRLSGGAGNDVLDGGAGDDELTGGSGNNVLRGGTGTDTAIFAQGRSEYSFMGGGAELIITDRAGGVNRVSEVEIFSFAGIVSTLAEVRPPPPPPSYPFPNTPPPQFFQLVPAGGATTVQGSGTVFGASNSVQQITVRDAPGAISFDGSFNAGGDRIILSGNASNYTVSRSGATVTISLGDTRISVPVGLGGADIVFGDGVRSLSFDPVAGVVRLGNQTIGTTSATITSPAGPAIATGITSDAVPSLLLVNAGAAATANGRLSVFGTAAGAETVTVAPGAILTFDGSFNAGGDTVRLSGNASAWTVSRSGATVSLAGPDGTQLAIPVGPSATTIRFDNGDRPLFLDTTAGQVKLGTTVIGTTAAPVAGIDGHGAGDPGLGFIG